MNSNLVAPTPPQAAPPAALRARPSAGANTGLLAAPKSDPRESLAAQALLGEHASMRAARERIARIAGSDATVLIRGESGTGKEVVAALLHSLSRRGERKWVKLNCAAIPAELLESELFGYEPGAFTGAARKKAGKFELAHGGTIFLDEISELQPAMQAKLLHILQGGEFSRLGAEESVRVEARVIAASNADLEAAVRFGRFRQDLYFRLNVVCIRLPPLRDRAEDIPLLCRHFLEKHAARYGPAPELSAAARERLRAYAWPGNVRELENFIQRYLILGQEEAALAELSAPAGPAVDLRAAVGGASPGGEPLDFPPKMPPRRAAASEAAGPIAARSLLEIGREAARQAEQVAILAALEQARWNRRQAARALKISYKALHNKLRALKTAMAGEAAPGEIAAGEIAPAWARMPADAARAKPITKAREDARAAAAGGG